MEEDNLWLDEEGRIVGHLDMDKKAKKEIKDTSGRKQLGSRLATFGIVSLIGFATLGGSYSVYKRLVSPSVVFVPEPIDMKLLEEKSTDILLLPTKFVHTDGSIINEGLFHYWREKIGAEDWLYPFGGPVIDDKRVIRHLIGHRVWDVDSEKLNRQDSSQYIIQNIKGDNWNEMFNFSYSRGRRDGKQSYEVMVESPDKRKRVIYMGERGEIGHPADLTRIILEVAPYEKNNEEVIKLNYETSIWSTEVYRVIDREIERKKGIDELIERAEKEYQKRDK